MKILQVFVVLSYIYQGKNAAQPTTPMKPNNYSTEGVGTASIYFQNVSNKVNHLHDFRRQNEDSTPGPYRAPLLHRKIKVNRGKKYESMYLPYYPEGDWVYFRNASTSFPRAFILMNQTDPVYRDCNQICLTAYLFFGKVCAMRLNIHDWMYEYQEFKNMCYLEMENCRTKGKRYYWFPVRQGPCATTEFPTPPNDTDYGILKRLKEFEKRFPENPAHVFINPFILTTRTPSPLALSRTPKSM